jgi:hypothetical protein
MKWSGWPLTAIIVAVSLAISYVLFQLGVYFFFLPIIFFIPFTRFSEIDNNVHTYVQHADWLHQETTVLDVVQEFKLYADFRL